jgi:hypothetical protein
MSHVLCILILFTAFTEPESQWFLDTEEQRDNSWEISPRCSILCSDVVVDPYIEEISTEEIPDLQFDN